MAIFGQKNIKEFKMYFLISFLVIKTLDPHSETDPYPDSLEMLDPDPDPQHCFFVQQI
jgi:hypothetical protein